MNCKSGAHYIYIKNQQLRNADEAGTIQSERQVIGSEIANLLICNKKHAV
jgi:hypothetical protein